MKELDSNLAINKAGNRMDVTSFRPFPRRYMYLVHEGIR